MGETLLTFKKTTVLDNGYYFDKQTLLKIYDDALGYIIESIPEESKKNSYISITANTNIGELQSKDIRNLISEVEKRQLDISGIRIYLNHNLATSDISISRTIDMYLNFYPNNSLYVHSNDEQWALKTKERLEWSFSKVPKIKKGTKPLWYKSLKVVFNEKLLIVIILSIPIILAFSKFIPNMTYAIVISAFIFYSAMAIIFNIYTENLFKVPVAEFNILNKPRELQKKLSFDQKIFTRITLYIFAFISAVAGIFYIIEFIIKILK